MNRQEEKEQGEMIIRQLDQLARAIFLWQIGLESMRIDGIEDITAVFEIIIKQIRLIQDELGLHKS